MLNRLRVIGVVLALEWYGAQTGSLRLDFA